MRALVLLVLLAGACTSPGRQLADWRVGDTTTMVTLPSRLVSELPWREVDYTLRADVALAPTEQHRELTLLVPCFHGAITATADTIPLEDRGDTGVGEHRFGIPAALTDRPSIALVLAAHHDNFSSVYGFGVRPTLAVGHAPAPPAAMFDRYFAFALVIMLLTTGVLYALIYGFDRRRGATTAAVLVQLLGVMIAPLADLGVLSHVFGHAAMAAFLPVFAITQTAIMVMFQTTFGLGRVPRPFLVVYALCGVLGLASPWSFALGFIGWWILGLSLIPQLAYVGRAMWVARGEHRFEALALVIALAIATTTLLVFSLAASLGVPGLVGWHFDTLGIIAFAVAQSVIVARQTVVRQRALEAATIELQHQVAERSKDLAAALARLAQVPPDRREPLGRDRLVDGRYRIITQLGAGGMGTVYEVERASDGKRLALKVLRRGRADADILARFAREAEIAAGISHPNLVPVLDVGIADGGLFLVMPLVTGGTLEHERARFGDAAWALPLLANAAAGLAALHARGIVHRDLKPANILLDGGVARIADFGLATLRGGSTGSGVRSALAPSIATDDTVAPSGNPPSGSAPTAAALTRAGDLFGTPLYMAPELADGVHEPAPASDVFAFGLVAYEVLSGTPAFAAPPVMARMSNLPIAPPDLTKLPPAHRAMIGRCLALDPAERPAAADLAFAAG